MSYNVPYVNLDVAQEVAVTYIESGIIPLLISPPGVGKTTMAMAVAKALGAHFRAIRLNNVAPEEVAGLQFIDRDGERSTHLPPKWMPKADGSDGPVLVFIDELSQAPDENRKAIMSALLERYLGDVPLPDNCYFMAAGNSAEDGTNVYELDRATADRFGVIKIKTDVESWCNDYARVNNVGLEVVAFLRLRPDTFEMSEELQKGDNVVGTSPRTWIAIDKFLKRAVDKNLSEEAVRAGVMGKAGIEVGSAFRAVRAEVLQLKTIRDLLRMKREDRAQYAPRTLEALWTYCQGMIWHATTIKGCVEVFDLLDSFEEVENIPFYETRFTVGEMVLQRGQKNGLGTDLFMDPTLQAVMTKWRAQLNDVQCAVPGDGTTNEVPDPVAMKMAA